MEGGKPDGSERRRAPAAANRLLRLEAITETALSHLDLGELLDELLDRIRDLLDADTAVMLLVDDDGQTLVPRAAQGFDEELEADVRIPIGAGFAGRVAATRSTVVIENLDEAEVVNPLLRERGLRSMIGVPLLHLGDLIGVVHAGAFETEHFSHEDGLVLQLAADRIALAITQSRLFEAERQARRDAEVAHRQVAFLARASETLADSTDPAETLERVAELAVPAIADAVLVDLVQTDGSLKRLVTAHGGGEHGEAIRRLQEQYPPDPEAPYGPAAVIRSGEPEFSESVAAETIAAVARDDEHRRLIEALGLKSYICVPLRTAGRTLGAITFIVSTSDRRYSVADLAFAQELARRAAAAVESAELRAEMQERARASLVLDHVGEGVFLLDRFGVVRLWNPAAEAITGVGAAGIVGAHAAEALPGWSAIADRVPVGTTGRPAELRPETVPLDLGERELWLLISGVAFPEGTVYAFRDVTQERELRDLQTEFVATVSHELRTPLAAVYGAAMTLQQRAAALDQAARERLLEVVFDEASRLSRIIDDILWASRLETGRLDFAVEPSNPIRIAESVVSAARVHLPARVSLTLTADESLPAIATDPDKVRQVLTNLVDNAIKYSPDGGRVDVRVSAGGRVVHFAVTDEGLGIPHGETVQIFEKFYRLDPNQTRGVGGTGLGLYISQELVRRMGGRIWVESEEGRGSTFHVALPVAQTEGPAEVIAHIGAR